MRTGRQANRTRLLTVCGLGGLLAFGIGAGAQQIIPLEWVRDSSSYLGDWTGEHLIDNAFTAPPGGVWGWGTQFGNTIKQYSDFHIVGDTPATITGFRLDSRPAPNFDDSDPFHFQLCVSMTNDEESNFQSVGTFQAQRATPSEIMDSNPHFQDYTLPQPVQAHYVRLYILDNYGNNYVQAREFRLLRSEVPAPPSWLLFALGSLLPLRQIAMQRRSRRARAAQL